MFTLIPSVLCVCSLGGAGAVDGECRPDPGEQRSDLSSAEDSLRTDPLLPHPADLPLHLREQKDGHHSPGVYNNIVLMLLSVWSESVITVNHNAKICSFDLNVCIYNNFRLNLT